MDISVDEDTEAASFGWIALESSKLVSVSFSIVLVVCTNEAMSALPATSTDGRAESDISVDDCKQAASVAWSIGTGIPRGTAVLSMIRMVVLNRGISSQRTYINFILFFS